MLLRPTHHRFPDEVVHEVPSDQCAFHRCREGRIQHRYRLSDRSRPAAAIPEEDAPCAAASRPAFRGVGNEIVPMLEVAPGVRAVAIFEELCRRHPEIAVGVRRTLERRIARWRALNGPSRDVIFARSIRRAGWACSEMSRPAFGRSPGRDRSRLLYTTTRRWMRSPQSSGCRKTP